MRSKIMFGVLAGILVVAAMFVVSARTVSITNQQSYSPNFQTYYTSAELESYWPVLKDFDPEKCEARQDLLLNVAPFGCKPGVVRSDLLADQNVPVFCQIDALKINPLIDIREIRNIRFTSKDYPPEVIGTGFHPARAALKTRDKLLGSPLINNIGYVVVVLKRNPNESALPDSVDVSLSAQVDYDSGNALGIGKVEFVLTEIPDEKWEAERVKNSFWGDYFVRLDDVDAEKAVVSIYRGENKVSSVTAEKGKLSREIYMPGQYCRAAIQVMYDKLEAAKDSARIEIVDERGTDSFVVYEGSKFFNDKCSIQDIDVVEEGIGNVSVRCGSESFDLIRAERGEGKVPEDDPLSKDVKSNFDAAIDAYEKVAEDYPAERASDVAGADTYGEQALREAIGLAGGFGQFKTEVRLLRKLLEKYPETKGEVGGFLETLSKIDSSKAVHPLNLDNRYRTVRLVGLSEPTTKPNADISLAGTKINGWEEGTSRTEGEIDFSFVDIVDVDEIEISCRPKEGKTERKKVELGETETLCGKAVSLLEVHMEEVAKIRLVPKAKGTGTETNLSVSIGIEKRAIQLTPTKVSEKIRTLNESIEKWEGISDRLNGTVDTLQQVCLATSLILTFRNLLSGMSGQTLARQKVMEDWNTWCDREVASGSYKNLNECYSKNSKGINDDVRATTKAIEDVNKRAVAVGKENEVRSGVLGRSVNSEGVRRDLMTEISTKYGDEVIEMPEKTKWGVGDEGKSSSVRVSDLLDENNLDSVSNDELREIYMNLERRRAGGFSDVVDVEGSLSESAGRISGNRQLSYNLEKSKRETTKGEPEAFHATTEVQRNRIASVVPADRIETSVTGKSDKVDSYAKVSVSATKDFEGGNYLVGLDERDGGVYGSLEVYKQTEKGYEKVENSGEFLSTFGIGNIKAAETISYNNKILKPEVRYYETEPYKGMPAIVPVDKSKGWYAATRQQLPTFGGIGAFDASGRVVSFELCNVGENGKAEVFNGYGDDTCQRINLNTGQPLDQFPGLSESEAKVLVNRAVKSITDAANQYGRGRVVRVSGNSYDVGGPAVNLPSTRCQDFMSPGDCNLLFNVCDPVICPPSRCNLGGKYHVPSVIQSGIVGSIVLCLPNFGAPSKGGVIIPVCLTGIKAGIDGYLSVLKETRSCYEENLETGSMTGICDQIQSIYICDLFWRELGPLTNLLLPTLFETLTGQGARGGGEYLTVRDSWNNARNTLDFYTNNYGVNAAEAFKARSLEQVVKSEVCDSYISAQAPDSFETTVEPESPPQFHAWFSTFKFSDTTVPPTSQYKVFYHVFSGNSQGTYYSVYLRNPPVSSFYSYPSTVSVASGFIARGESESETRDFTAPEGYKELCVNINGKEECGFRQVSTNFAINYLRDEYVKGQIEKEDIQSEKECIGGSPSLGALATLGGPQAIVEEAVMPDVYNRGVVRICSTDIPGSPERWVSVGNCGDVKVKCWLDKGSVDKAITDNNEGLRNQTVQNLQKITDATLEESNFLTDGDAVAEIKSLEEAKGRISKDKDKVSREAKAVISRIEFVFDRVVFNHRKARLLLLKAEVYEKVARVLGKATIESVKKVTEGEEEEEVEEEEERFVYSNEVVLVFEEGEDEVLVRWVFETTKIKNKPSVVVRPDGEEVLIDGLEKLVTSVDDEVFESEEVRENMFSRDVALVKLLLQAETPGELSEAVYRIIRAERASLEGSYTLSLDEINMMLYGDKDAPSI